MASDGNDESRLHWVIFGCGAVGGYFGARLLQSGARVTFLVRGETLAALQAQGLRVHSISGDVTIPPERLQLVDTAALPAAVSAADRADVLVLACKTWQARAALRQCAAYLHTNTAVLPLQNGVDGIDELQQECAAIQAGRVLGGYCNIVAAIVAPGVINHFAAQPPYIQFGDLSNAKTPTVLAMEEAFARCPGMKGTAAEDILASMWEKFVFISTTASVNAIAHATQDQIAHTPPLLALWTDAAQEVIALARRRGVNYQDAWLSNRVRMMAQAVGGTTSMARDLWAGRRSELEELGGSVVAMGKALGVPTPIHETMLRALRFHELQARGELARPETIQVLEEGRSLFGLICSYKGQSLPRMADGDVRLPHFYVAPSSAYIDGRPGAGARTKVPPGAEMMFEVELGVVIDRTCSRASAADAMGYVGGYLVALDMTAKNFGFADMDLGVSWTRSKCYDTFKPISAFIPRRSLPDPDDVTLFLTVNGEPRGTGRTRDLRFPIQRLIEHISSICTLHRGDVILTGAPFVGDCGVGDVVVGGIEGLPDDARVQTTLVTHAEPR